MSDGSISEIKQLTTSLEAIVAGFVVGLFADCANCTFFFFGVFATSALRPMLPANGGRHTTQYMICRWAKGANADFSVETGAATSEEKQR